jgi:hypothetical protein
MAHSSHNTRRLKKELDAEVRGLLSGSNDIPLDRLLILRARASALSMARITKVIDSIISARSVAVKKVARASTKQVKPASMFFSVSLYSRLASAMIQGSSTTYSPTQRFVKLHVLNWSQKP